MFRIALCVLACFALFAVASADNDKAKPLPVVNLYQQCKSVNKRFRGFCSNIESNLHNRITRVIVECEKPLRCAGIPFELTGKGSREVFAYPGLKPLDGTACGTDKNGFCQNGTCVKGVVPIQEPEQNSFTCFHHSK